MVLLSCDHQWYSANTGVSGNYCVHLIDNVVNFSWHIPNTLSYLTGLLVKPRTLEQHHSEKNTGRGCSVGWGGGEIIAGKIM